MQPNGNMPGAAQPASPVRPVVPVGPTKPVNPAAPVKPAAPAGGPTFDNGPSVVDGKGSKKTGWILAVVLLLIVAIGGVGFGVWAMMDGNAQKDALNSQISSLKQQNNSLQEQLDNSDINVDGDEGTADYIYVGEWGLKIKIPEELKWVGYQYITNGGDETCDEISVTGAIDKDGQTPDFVRTIINSDASFQGSIMRCTGDVEIRYYSAGVDLNDEYEYYYNIKQSALSESQREWDSESTNLIQEMLINPENYSEI